MRQGTSPVTKIHDYYRCPAAKELRATVRRTICTNQNQLEMCVIKKCPIMHKIPWYRYTAVDSDFTAWKLLLHFKTHNTAPPIYTWKMSVAHSRAFDVSSNCIQCESRNPPPWWLVAIFPKRLGIFQPNFARLLRVPIYARLRIFIQLPATLTKLCHIKRDHPVHIMCAKCPPSAETHFLTFFPNR